MAELSWLPKHKCELTLSHNEHRNSYTDIESYLACLDVTDDEWLSPEDRAKAIETDELWHLQWYPDTPIGFRRLFASSLDALRQACEGLGDG